MPETLEQAVARWIEWLAVLRRELMEIYVDKLMFDELYEAIRTSGISSGFWLNHYQKLYVSKQTMAVRRITRGRAGTISFTRLFIEISGRRSELTDAWFRTLVSQRSNPGASDLDRVVQEFSMNWCGCDIAVAQAVINSDRQALGQRVNSVREWADITVAHLNDNGEAKKLTWGELNNSFETIADALNRYERLFTGSIYVLPPALPLNWQEPFDRVLFPSTNADD